MKNYGEEILQMVDICKVFDLGDGKKLHAAENVNVTIHKGETVGIVGESGSGKSTLAKMLTRLYTMTSGKIIFHGKDITDLKGEALRQHRKSIQMVFQDPSTAFNPKQRVKEIICEPLENFGMIEKKDVEAKAEIIVCDEATSALDVSVQKTVLDLLDRLQKETHVAYMFICHDLALANSFCDNIVIMQHGKVVEKIHDLREAKDPYSKKLLASVFTIEEGKNKVLPDELFN